MRNGTKMNSSTTANVCPKLLVQFRRQNRILSARLISGQMIIAKGNVFFTKQRNTTIIVTQDDLFLVFYTTVGSIVAKIETQEF